MDCGYTPDKEKVTATACALIRHYYAAIKHFGLDAGCYWLDRAALKDVAERYWTDVDRLHRYHGMARIDRHKIAGYLTYWICKLRPIMVVKNDIWLGSPSIPQFINETFAIFVALGRLQAHHDTAKTGKDITVKSGFYNALRYSLRYRLLTADMLSMAYYLIEEAKPIEPEKKA